MDGKKFRTHPNCLIQKNWHIRGGHDLTRKHAEEHKKKKAANPGEPTRH